MKLLVAGTAGALLALAACNAPAGDAEDDRTEQRGQDDDGDNDDD